MQFTNKQIWQITYPVLISLLMEHMIGLTDTAYLGRVGEVELGASALAGVYYLVIYMLGFGFSVGAQVLIARRNGAQAVSYTHLRAQLSTGLYPDRTGFHAGSTFPVITCCYLIYGFPFLFTGDSPEADRLG